MLSAQDPHLHGNVIMHMCVTNDYVIIPPKLLQNCRGRAWVVWMRLAPNCI